MAETSELIKAFQEDHRVLGRGFYEISTALRGGDMAKAKDWAARVDREAGAHIAFEEEVFYPRLRELVGEEETDRLYDEHGEGLRVVQRLKTLGDEEGLDDSARQELLEFSEEMENHIAECGTLFGTIGRIPPAEQDALLSKLLEWRRKAPTWSDFARVKQSGG